MLIPKEKRIPAATRLGASLRAGAARAPAGPQSSRGGQQLRLLAWMALLLLVPLLARAQVAGRVVNETTGEAPGRVALTLMKFDEGMDLIEEVYSDPDGSFAFQKSLTGASGQQVPGMVRAEFQGVSFSQMIPPTGPTGDIRVSVYTVEEKGLPPDSHIIIFEPGAGEMVVNETFIYSNRSAPPKAYRDPVRGTLRFYLPPDARDVVRVSVQGPAGMPLRSTAEQTDQENVRKLDFPIKPGENRVDLTYLVPHQEGAEFEARVLYPGLLTRVAAPAGVTISGAELTPMGEEPHTQASVYELPALEQFRLTISGQGRLSRAADSAGEAGGSGGALTVAPAPIKKEMVWVIVLTCAILGVGFYSLLTNRAASAEVAVEPGTKSRKVTVPKTPSVRSARGKG